MSWASRRPVASERFRSYVQIGTSDHEWLYRVGGFVSIHVGDTVAVLRDIQRAEGTYATAGERGVVVEIFYPPSSGVGQKPVPHAKVNIGGQIKTLRLTSIASASTG